MTNVPGETVFSILLVCTGNRFRSPLAEGFLRRHAQGLPLHVQSVGTLDLGPVGAFPEAVALGREFGLDISDHRARPISRELVETSDLVICFERDHMASIVVDHGAALDRTFMLLELTTLLGQVKAPPGELDPVARAGSAVALAAEARAERVHPAAGLELPDPMAASTRSRRETALLLRRLTGGLVTGLFGEVPDAPARRAGLRGRVRAAFRAGVVAPDTPQ
jgi:protein-tyrosine-phosphatase